MNTLAIDIGGTKFSIALFQGERMAVRESRQTDREGGRDWMLEQILAIANEWCGRFSVDCCGVGFGGPVYFPEQRVAVSTHVGGWKDFLLTAFLERELHVPVIMDNDANVGALGEAVYGAGAGCDPLLYMTLSTGIGGGIVIGNRIFRGADSWAGEIGHITVRPDGPQCMCGAYGCFERMCSGIWMVPDHGQPAEVLLRDPEFVKCYVVNLAIGLKACTMLLNPARIVIGGGISKAGDALFVPLRAELRRQMTDWSKARVDIEPAKLGDDSVLYGALALAAQKDSK